MSHPIPEEFKTMMQSLLKDEAEDFLRAMEKPPVTSVRLNKRKPGAKFDGAKPVKWCKSGLYLSERPQFILDPLLHAGAYYVQDASSMIHEHIGEMIAAELSPKKIDVLDLCAAPGGKTTALINGLPDGTHFTANEISQKRVGALKENLAKWGYPLVKITNLDTSAFALSEKAYDVVVVDAPCSGEGMMRKDDEARAQWSYNLINQCVSLQKEILRNAEKALKPGGFLIYSTCTFNREENENNAEFIMGSLKLEPYDPSFPEEWGIRRGIDTDIPVYRFMPHKTEGEGLFLAIFRKRAQPRDDDYSFVLTKESNLNLNDSHRKNKQFTVIRNNQEKRLKKQVEEIPAIEEILKIGVEEISYPKVELTKEQALNYLRRESFRIDDKYPSGIVIFTYNGLALGAGKNIGSRVNNIYPKQWRILQR